MCYSPLPIPVVCTAQLCAASETGHVHMCVHASSSLPVLQALINSPLVGSAYLARPLPCARWAAFLETPRFTHRLVPCRARDLAPVKPLARWRVPCFGRSGVAQAGIMRLFWSRQTLGGVCRVPGQILAHKVKGGRQLASSYGSHSIAKRQCRRMQLAILDMHLEERDRLAIGTIVHVISKSATTR